MRAIRFYPDLWRAFSDQLTRIERDVYFDLCCQQWANRGPVTDAEINGITIDMAGQRAAVIGTLFDLGFIIRQGGGYVCTAVREMKRGTVRRCTDAAWAAIRRRIFARDDFTCRYCRARGGRLECDHVFPWSRGGSDDDENLVAACLPCNRKKGNKTLEEMGWTI